MVSVNHRVSAGWLDGFVTRYQDYDSISEEGRTDEHPEIPRILRNPIFGQRGQGRALTVDVTSRSVCG